MAVNPQTDHFPFEMVLGGFRHFAFCSGKRDLGVATEGKELLMPLEVQYQVLTIAGILFGAFCIVMPIWARKQKEESCSLLLEKRYPLKDKFSGDWQICRRLRLETVRGHDNVDIGCDGNYLYLRPRRSADVVRKCVKIPRTKIDQASIAGSFIHVRVDAGEKLFFLDWEMPI